jgi:(E)-4-hydroxy-3-methylbut-2-enyl-diphosphate synthase
MPTITIPLDSQDSTSVPRRRSVPVRIGSVTIGGSRPVAVQSMTNTDTADAAGTAAQVIALAEAGSELVRVTVNTPEAARSVPEIVARTRDAGIAAPIVGDFHFSGHLLLTQFPDCARALDKYRINPGNVGSGERHDEHFSQIIRIAVANGKPVRIGVNWGSLDRELLTALMDQNARSATPREDREVTLDAMFESAVRSAALAEEFGQPHDAIVLSAKVSGCARSDRDLPPARRRDRLSAPSRIDRGGDGSEGSRRVDRGTLHASPRGYRRHDSREPHAAARR